MTMKSDAAPAVPEWVFRLDADPVRPPETDDEPLHAVDADGRCDGWYAGYRRLPLAPALLGALLAGAAIGRGLPR